jgi:predicted dehydrogenase
MTRTAVVGLGAIAFEHLKKLRERRDVEVAGVCDLSLTLARAVSERFGGPPVYEDYDRMLHETRPDVVHVLTPPQAHPRLVLDALEAGAHVFVEKPVATTFDAYAHMRDVAVDRRLMLCENYNYRFGHGVLAALQALDDGALGSVSNVDVSFGGVMGGSAYADRVVPHFAHALPGGALQNFVSHPVSIALAFIGDCTASHVVQRRLDPAFESNDELRALLHGSAGCAVITVSRHSLPHFELTVEGTHGRADVDVYSGRIGISTAASSVVSEMRRGFVHFTSGADIAARAATGRRDTFEGLGTLLDRFYGAVAGDVPPPVTTADMTAVNGVVRDILTPAYAL